MFAGGIFAFPAGNDHVQLTYEGRTPSMMTAFRYAGQGKIAHETLATINGHQGVVYLHFPIPFTAQRDRLRRFTEVLSRCGGIAVKVESSGIAHEWPRWFELLASDHPFDSYCACVVLVGDEEAYYSCGMHLFGLPETEVSRDLDPTQAAGLINDFNLYQLNERPELATGHTFSLAKDSPIFRLIHSADQRHDADDLFHNPHGVWRLESVE